MSKPFDVDHPEQASYEEKMSIWGTEATSAREKYAYRDGHYAGWTAALAGIEDIAGALRLAIAEKRAFVLCLEGRNGSTATLHNYGDAAQLRRRDDLRADVGAFRASATEHSMSTNSAPTTCQRLMADGEVCGLPPGCQDCGRCLVDVGPGA